MDSGFGSASDPYVIVKLGGKQIARTKSISNNNNPVWGEKFQVDVSADPTSELVFELWDEDSFQRDDLIGKVEIELQCVKSTKKLDGEQELNSYQILGSKIPATASLILAVNIRKFGGELSNERGGTKKALQIGINYLDLPAGKGRLNGCFNDVEVMNELLKTRFNFADDNIKILRDDDPNNMPTFSNIVNAIQWLVDGAQKGDSLFFQFSGHGGQVDDQDGDEEDSKDETIIPCDFRSAGQITDDLLFKSLVSPLKAGVFLTIIMDCCHSGTGMDLPYIHKIHTSKVNLSGSEFSSSQFEHKQHTSITNEGINGSSSDANAVMFSGCLDHQTSADAKIQGKFSGAMTFSLKTALERCNFDTNYQQLLIDMHQVLTDGNYSQIPQLSTARPFHLKSKFTF